MLFHPQIIYHNTLLEGLIVFNIVNMTWNPCPIFQTFYMIKKMIHEVFMSPPARIRFTSSTPLPRKSIEILKRTHFVLRLTQKMVAMDKLDPLVVFECHVIVHGTNPFCTKRFDLDSKSQRLSKAKVVKLCITTSRQATHT